ncbi:MAG: NTP transferase domain-containing protein [Dyadobacter sp.]|uniref:sugar phosphate nucleotidyltransferase n=1 Tax=Dyadobacter sp. TaxID=1914288 RepID=UPI001B2BAB5F|nr:sugar phosphate nucleotidyltransferase [Dyadobacter sp.]MBO9613683.1 NTP transferase domain-containing protein [Dyadobacter sp.]
MYWNSEMDPRSVNVVIMAGGKGTRLKPLTDNTHKSLIPVGGKPIIRHLIDHLRTFGFREIHISVGHMAEQITSYLGDGREMGVIVRYLQEHIPMGSIGAMTLKRHWPHEHFLVINGDVYSNFDIGNLSEQYFSRKADMAVLAAPNIVKVPYGVLEITSDGYVNSLAEKPDYEFMVNAGVYLFNKKVLNLLPKGISYEGWQLVQSALHTGLHVAGVTQTTGYWIDIGSMETLGKAQEMSQTGIEQE